jgi:hypothetical protein
MTGIRVVVCLLQQFRDVAAFGGDQRGQGHGLGEAVVVLDGQLDVVPGVNGEGRAGIVLQTASASAL